MCILLKLLVCSTLASVAFAKSEEEIKAYFVTLGLECIKDNPITPQEMLTLHQHKPPTTENGKCLLACTFKKAQWMDDKGMFNIDNANAMMEKEHIDDSSKLESSKKLFETCKTVDDETVSDGEKGCERAVLLSTCLIENAPKVGLKLLAS